MGADGKSEEEVARSFFLQLAETLPGGSRGFWFNRWTWMASYQPELLEFCIPFGGSGDPADVQSLGKPGKRHNPSKRGRRKGR